MSQTAAILAVEQKKKQVQTGKARSRSRCHWLERHCTSRFGTSEFEVPEIANFSSQRQLSLR
jgi:hypothetical protein